MTGLNGKDTSHQPLIPFGVTSFVVVERTVRLTADDPQFAGFEVDVRSNLAGFERERLIAGLDEIDAAQRTIFAQHQARAEQIDAARAEALAASDAAKVIALRAETTALLESMERSIRDLKPRKYPLIAPYVHAWNVYEPDDAGGYREIPPPRVAGAEAFAHITEAMADWLVGTVVGAYKSGKGLGRPTSDASPPPGSVPIVGGPRVNPRSTPASRPRSLKPSA